MDVVLKTLKRLCLLGLILLLPASAGWFGDSVLDLTKDITTWPAGKSWYCLDGWFGWFGSMALPWPHEAHVHAAGVFGGFLVFALAALSLLRFRHALGFPTSDARILPKGAYEGRSVLIMGLSPKRREGDIEQAAIGLMASLPLERSGAPSDELKESIGRLSTDDPEKPTLERNQKILDSYSRNPWRQNFRLIWHHLAGDRVTRPLRRVIVVTSEGASGSQACVNEFMELVRGRVEDAMTRGVISRHPFDIAAIPGDGINFEDYTAVFNELTRVVEAAGKDYQAKHDDICIDVTAGQKIYSVAAAVVTMNRKLIFSYVNGEGKPRFYDARIELGAALGKDE